MHPTIAHEMEQVGLDIFDRQPGDHSILVVDDDDDIRDMIAFRLVTLGYHVMTATDGPSALAAVDRELPDLVVLDVAMPGLSGIEVCRLLRADRRTERLPVIVLTAAAHFDSIRSGIAAGANAYLLKPFQLRLLVREIEELLSH